MDLIFQLLNEGAKIKYIQAYTIARKPADEQASPWNNQEMNMLRKKLTIICVLLLWALPWANALSAELPVEHFFRNFEFSRVTLSPDGKYLAAIAPVGESRNLVVVERGTKKPVAVTTLTKKDVAGYAWASDTRLVFYLEEDGNESFGINAVNFDGSQPRTLTRAERGITVIPR